MNPLLGVTFRAGSGDSLARLDFPRISVLFKTNLDQHTGDRLAACWNACAGMDDPVAEVAKLRASAKAGVA